MKLKPLNDWAVILPSSPEEVTAGGLYIPDSAKEKPAEGVVEAIGPGALEEKKHGKKKKEEKERVFIPTTVKPGDHVLYERYAGQTYTIGSEERILVRERDILGILSRGPKPAQIPAVTSSPAAAPVARAKQAVVKTATKKTLPKKSGKK